MLGRPIPDVTLKSRVRDEALDGPNPFRWQDLNLREAFDGRKVVVFSLPGAFTPTCSNEQCPNFDRLYDEFHDLGIDDVYCVSVNDAFVMYQWGKLLGLKNVKLLPDGSGAFTRRMGMLINKDHLGFGMRSWRYAMVVDNNRIAEWFEEPGINDIGADEDPYGQTSPENLLQALKAKIAVSA
ncbi:MAG: peroxiredoxin [Sphingomonadaceae bacterium]|nr:peroxiredoxin [Sphingomonadaceae bacterium]